MSMIEFNSALGFKPKILICDFPYDFDVAVAYSDLCDNPPDAYCLNKSKDLFLHNPCFKYLHRFLAYTFSGRKDASNILTKIVLFFSLVHGVWAHVQLWILACHPDFWNLILSPSPHS